MGRKRENGSIDAGGHAIWAGQDALAMLGHHLTEQAPAKVILLADVHTVELCLPELLSRVPALAEAETIIIPAGEAAKSLEVCGEVWRRLIALAADRHDLLLCLGGGVVTDVGGFVAGTYKRGIRCAHVPTTLMGMADAAIGGKTAIDLHAVKNPVGVFHDPIGVYIHVPFLRTLGKRELMNGVAEMLKHGVVHDADHWQDVTTAALHDLDVLAPLVARSAAIKAALVKADPREQGVRRLLNFGHTIGHGVEACSWEGVGRSLLHGEAVVVGMVTASWIAHRLGMLPKADHDQITDGLLNLFKPVDLHMVDDERVLELMRNDKKNRNDAFRFALPERIGHAVADVPVTADLVLEALAVYRGMTAR